MFGTVSSFTLQTHLALTLCHISIEETLSLMKEGFFVLHSILQSSKPAPEPAAKFPPPPMKMRDPCTGKPVAAPANEDTSVGKQIKVSPAQPTIGVKSPPKTFAKGTGKLPHPHIA